MFILKLSLYNCVLKAKFSSAVYFGLEHVSRSFAIRVHPPPRLFTPPTPSGALQFSFQAEWRAWARSGYCTACGYSGTPLKLFLKTSMQSITSLFSFPAQVLSSCMNYSCFHRVIQFYISLIRSILKERW